MLQELFYWLFNMSITASVTGVPVLLIRQFKKIPRRMTVLLWLIPFLRMSVPVGLNSPFSLMSLLSRISSDSLVLYAPWEDVPFSILNSVMAADSYFPIRYKSVVLENVFGVASIIWIAVFLAILLVMAVTYVTTVREIRDSRHFRDNIYLSSKVLSPGVYGIAKPRILLPASYPDRNMDLVILHEKTHIRSLDNLWRMVALIIAGVHWFNPLSWVFLKYFLADLELACDERVLAKLGAERAKEYAASLLEFRQSTPVFASSFGGAKIRTRIENILSFRKMTLLSLAVFSILICVVCYVLLTNAG